MPEPEVPVGDPAPAELDVYVGPKAEHVVWQTPGSNMVEDEEFVIAEEAALEDLEERR